MNGILSFVQHHEATQQSERRAVQANCHGPDQLIFFKSSMTRAGCLHSTRGRSAITEGCNGEDTHEIVFSLGELVKLLDETWLQVQGLWPAKDWRAIRGPEHWEELQNQIDAELQ